MEVAFLVGMRGILHKFFGLSRTNLGDFVRLLLIRANMINISHIDHIFGNFFWKFAVFTLFFLVVSKAEIKKASE
ncbi:hypothetical protein ATN88_25200 [Enterovibrio coralii]|uniref:Uncharacterized protein n=1 Tax=Enterovibrio coralii TaxID=294935 RepID=A0A135IBN2_9GAMM|nr:hypothetical protein ATN88_25200 [Enterovibrio coralii]